MKNLIIIGAGGFGRELKGLVDQINKVLGQYNILGFVDDAPYLDPIINGIPLLGDINFLIEKYSGKKIAVALGVGDPLTKSNIVEKLSSYDFTFPILIHPNAIVGEDCVKIGRGTVICAGTVITCNIVLGEFVTLNLACTVGHDTAIGKFSSFMPSVNVSGEVTIEEKVYVGTGAKIINQLSIGTGSIIGAGAVVAKSLPSHCTAVGIPAKPIKFHD